MMSFTATGKEWHFNSPIERVKLVELYTSEGCSSCPPAEAWLATLQHSDQLWRGIVPVAFHVDYWNYLGWRDRFSQNAFSQRQRSYKQQGAVKSVYTPGFVGAGKEWRQWFRGQRKINPDTERVGKLKVSVKGKKVAACFNPAKDGAADKNLNIAVMGMNIESRITRGENRNKQLTHGFVVLAHNETGSNSLCWVTMLPKFEANSADELALAFWVTEAGSQYPIQATGGWFSSNVQ